MRDGKGARGYGKVRAGWGAAPFLDSGLRRNDNTVCPQQPFSGHKTKRGLLSASPFVVMSIKLVALLLGRLALLALGQHLVHDAVFDRLLRVQIEIAVRIMGNLLQGLAGVLDQDGLDNIL